MGKERSTVLVFFLIAIIVVLAFTGLLVVSDFQLNYVDSLVSSYEVSGQQSVNKIEYSLRYGKPLENFYGIEETLKEVQQDLPEITEVQIVSTDGQVMYDTDGIVEDKRLPIELQELSNFGNDEISAANEGVEQTEGMLGTSSTDDNSYSYGTHEGNYHVFLPIQGQDSQWHGSFQIVFPAEIINDHVTDVIVQLVLYLIAMALIGFLVLLILSRWINFINAEGKINKKNFLVTSMIVLGLIQIAFGLLNYNTFRNEYQDIAQNNTTSISNIISNDVESVLNLGVTYDQLYQLEKYLANIVDNVPEISMINLNTLDGETTYSTQDVLGSIETSELNLDEMDRDMIHRYPMIEDNQQNAAAIELILSEEYFAERMQNILLDSLTVLLLSIVLMIEIVLFMVIILQWKYTKKRYLEQYPEEVSENLGVPGYPKIDGKVIRMLVLIIGAAVFMSASFIPLRMQELYHGSFLGLSKDMILGLPISSEMLFAAVAAILAGRLITSRGWYFPLSMGLIIFGGGLFLSYYAFNELLFIIARALTGAGYGFSLLSIRGYIINEVPSEERMDVFPNYVSGLYAGFIVGTVTGGMLADRLGFAQVFLVALGLCILAITFILVLLRPEQGQLNQAHEESTAEDTSEKGALPAFGVFNFLASSKILIFFVLVVLPLTISSMYVDYFFPIFAASEGATMSNVGRAFMLNGIAIAYLGPFLSKHAEKKLGATTAILVSGIIIAGGLILFFNISTLTVAFIVVVLIGVSESFGLVAQSSYFIRLKEVQSFGESNALGYYENARKLGQMLGPMVFSSFLALGMFGVGLIGIITLVMTIFFVFSLLKRS